MRAYRNAARVVGGYSKSMADLIDEGHDLSELPGIGKDLAQKIETIVEAGSLPLLEEVKGRTPEALGELTHIAGLGPKRVQVLYHELGIDSLEDLTRAVEDGRIRELEGFGAKSEEKIKQGIERLAGAEKRTLLVNAEEVAEPLVEHLKKSKGIKQITVAGSYRRRRETVGDLDILATCKRDSNVMDRFVDYDEIEEVVSKGTTRSTVLLRSGMQVDLRVVPEVSYGAALAYFTGSKAHNIAVRKIGVGKGYKTNEYGIFKGEKRIAGKTEEEVYEAVGLPYIEPELREDRGEIDAAKAGKLPKLIRLQDLRGDLHIHTKATDGHDTIERIAKAAAERGLDYIAVTDHSKHVAMAHGLDAKALRKQLAEIDRLNERDLGVTLLKGCEVDILEDGSLDLPDDVLAGLDITVCAVHYNRELSRKKQTDRIIRAMDDPHFHILAHPTGRLLNEREPYAVDVGRLLEAAKERGCCVELDGQPSRLDLPDNYCKLAKEMGVPVAISSDAHSAAQLDYLRYGIDQARRGWLERGDVVNARSLTQLRKLLKRG